MFHCSECKESFKKWSGQCDSCGSWNTLTEEAKVAVGSLSKFNSIDYGKISTSSVDIVSIANVKAEQGERFSSSDPELDNVLGGGFVVGSATLLGGDPGVGKSTLLMKTASLCVQQGKKTLYVSGEESVNQVALRFKRMSLDQSVDIASTSDLLAVIKSLQKSDYKFVVIDSIQTMFLSTVDSKPGSSSQIQACAMELVSFCKANDITVVIIGHITKDGSIAGPKVLEHMVDVVMYFEGDQVNNFRVLRSLKNRFGSTNEIGIFQINENSIDSIINPSMFFLENHAMEEGSIVFVAIEGTRAVIAEVEALVAQSYVPMPRRTVLGWDVNRLSMILALLGAKAHYSFSDKDVYLGFAGGFKTLESANDLAVACSIMLSRKSLVPKYKIVALGELSLSGKVRPVSSCNKRIKEAVKAGYVHFIVSADQSIDGFKDQNLNFYAAQDVRDLSKIIQSLSSKYSPN